MEHELKCKSRYYYETISGNKLFEIRRNDRDFQKGDTILLCEIDDTNQLTGCSKKLVVTFVTSFAQKEGYVVLGVSFYE